MTYRPSPRIVPTGEIGRAEHFHGRADVWRAFKDALKNAQRGIGGTVFLVQGPPGAGKSAILYEFGERADAMPSWTHCHIDIDALHDPVRLARMLGDDTYADRSTTSTKGTTTVGGQVVVSGQCSWHADESTERSGPSVDELLIKHATNTGLLLTMDEVQRMASHLQVPFLRPKLESTLNAIRNSELRVPVVLLAGGLGNSLGVLSEFGMSRLPGDCVVNLGGLDADAERRVIRDWIVKSGGVGDAHPHIVTQWVDSIAAETDGWPQHIHSFAPQAAQWLQDHGSLMPEEVPEAVMAAGRMRKLDYYEQRIEPLENYHLHALANLVLASKSGKSVLTKEALVHAFEGATNRIGHHLGLMPPWQAVQVAIKKGVVATVPRSMPKRLSIPIPSMERWLLSGYGDRA